MSSAFWMSADPACRYDTTTSLPHLYWIDYLGTKASIPYAAHGFGMYVALSTMDKWWFEGMGKEKGVELLKKCINEVQTSEYAEWSEAQCAQSTPSPTFQILDISCCVSGDLELLADARSLRNRRPVQLQLYPH